MTISELRTFIQERVIQLVENKIREEMVVIKEGAPEIERDMLVAIDSDGKISGTELQDIAVENGLNMDDDDFLKIYANVRNRILKIKDEDLKDDIQFVIDTFFDGSAPESFNEFYHKFREQHFDNNYEQSDVFNKFKALTEIPNQLSMFEAKKEKGEAEAEKNAGPNGEYTYTRKEPCEVCGSHQIYVGPESGGWKSCAGCGTV